MPAPRKYDQETHDRAGRMYQDRRRDFPAESALQARRRVGELLDVKPETLQGWVEPGRDRCRPRSSPRASPTTWPNSSERPSAGRGRRVSCSPVPLVGSCGGATFNRFGSAPPTSRLAHGRALQRTAGYGQTNQGWHWTGRLLRRDLAAKRQSFRAGSTALAETVRAYPRVSVSAAEAEPDPTLASRSSVEQ